MNICTGRLSDGRLRTAPFGVRPHCTIPRHIGAFPPVAVAGRFLHGDKISVEFKEMTDMDNVRRKSTFH